MSTRSGKRLHNSPTENIVPETVSKKDRKTRNKRVENDDGQAVSLKLKKRQNYVSFPANEETSVVDYVLDEVETKSARALRRNTLKEQNAVSEEIASASSVKKQVRSTRRTKKFFETAADNAPESTPNEEPVEIVTVTNGKSKSKKNKKKSKEAEQPELTDKENEVKVGKKKKNKKNKNTPSNSLVHQGKPEEKKKNESNVSTDSFHSAAGSPVHEAVTSPVNKSSPKHAETENKKSRSSIKRISGLNTSTQVLMEVDENVDTNIEKEAEIVGIRQSKRRRSSLKIVPDQYSKSVDTNEKVNLNATFEKESIDEGSNKKKRKCNLMVENTDIPLTTASSNLDIPKTSNLVLNTTFEKDDTVNGTKIHVNKKSDSKDQAKEISENTSQSLNTSFEIRKSRKSINASDKSTSLNGTFDMSPKPDQIKQKSLDSTFDKVTKLDSTFDKTSKKASLGLKSSLITSDEATNSSIVTLDKSDSSKISITDDDSKTENILNTTPLLIESSMEESKVLENKTPEFQPKPRTPLKRESTFTKDGPEASPSPKTPTKRQTLPAAGCTPYHSNGKGSQKKRSIMNLTHSIEKPTRRSSPVDAAPRARVVFCSPVNLPGVHTQRKTNIIKSNLKGSNKSFVFDESVSSLIPERPARKRSHTHAEGEQDAAAKRSRLAPLAAPAHRSPARARTASAMAKLSNTPAKSSTPSAARSEVKATKLPNFAALHARRFQRMESLDECQQRRAQRARLLLVPTGSVAVLERSSPRGSFQRMESLDECQQRRAQRARLLLVPTGSVAVLERSSPRGSFQRMESLDECQQRRAQRARLLLVPTGSVAVLERSSPRGSFQRMESLDECQQRRAQRARLLLVPTGSVAVLERSSPRGSFQRMESLDECQQRRAQRARLLLVPTGSVAVLERSSPRGSFQRMESLDECQQRRAQRARLLLVPTGSVAVLERSSPRGSFQRMESLDECQQRRAQRARLLLVPTGSVAVLERSSPRATPTANKLEPKPKDTPPKTAAPAQPAAKLASLHSLQRGYTRFGFRMNCDVNPFSIPPATAAKPEETKPVGLVKPKGNKPNGAVRPLASLKRQVTQPSLAGATSLRRELAKHAIMREKSFTLAEKRNETRKEVRTVIKGVRTNRRFELQMKSRNING